MWIERLIEDGTTNEAIGSGMVEKATLRFSTRNTQVIGEFPILSNQDCVIFVGGSSWFYPSGKHRIIKQGETIPLYDFPVTRSETVRDYLDTKYRRRLQAFASQADAIKRQRSFPYLSSIGHYPDMVYLDIKGAYWTLLQIFGWDVEYMPGQFLGKRSEVDDFPLPADKLARNMIVSTGISNTVRVWTGDKLLMKNVGNKFTNFGLWAAVQDTLHALAKIAIRMGAVYVHTDGYIIPAFAADYFLDELEQWGIPAKIEARGHAIIHGVGNYQIGNRKAKRFMVVGSGNAEYINDVDVDWLKKRVSFFAKRSRLRYGKHDIFNRDALL